MSQGSHIVADGSQVRAYVGKDAVEFARVRMLRSSLIIWQKTGMIPTRGVTVTRMLGMCHAYTGKSYKRGEVPAAVADLEVWLNTMNAALPMVNSAGVQVS